MSKRPDANQLALLSRVATIGDSETLQKLLAEWQFDRSRLNEAMLGAAEHCSVASGHFHCVETLLAAGASVHASCADGETFLMRACSLGQIQLVELALERGARIRDCDHLRRTALHYAVDSTRGDNGDVVKLLLEHGANPNACDNAGQSPLHYAASRGAYLSLKVLLQAHAFVGLQDSFCHTALDLAIASGHQRCIECFRTRPAHDEEKPLDHARPREDALTLLSSPGPDLGEELETKSGSSFSSRHITCDQDTHPARSYAQVMLSLEREIANKRGELREETAALEVASQEADILAKEYSWLRLESQLEQDKMSVLLQELQNQSLLSQSSILSFQKKPVVFHEQAVLSRLQTDIDLFMHEVDRWQASVSPLISRAVDRWRGIVSCIFPGTQIKVYGSVAADLHLPTSTVDVVLLNSHFGSMKTLRRLEEFSRHESFIASVSLDVSRHFPVLLVTTQGEGTEVRLQVTVADARHRGLRCTQVIKTMLETAPLLRPVYMTLKQVMRSGGADCAQRGGLGAYGLLLMTAVSLQRESCRSAAEHVFRFLSFFGFEFDYRSAVSFCWEELPETPYQQLVLPDPVVPQSNVASGTDLFFLTVMLTQRFLQVAYSSIVCRAACACETSQHVLFKLITEMRTSVVR